MKCQAITNAPLRNLASCVTSTGIQSFQTSWLCPQISLPSMQSWFVASSQWRTPGEQGYKVSAAKGGWEGRAPTVTPGVFPLPTSLQAETGCHRALSIMSLAILSILASPQWQMSWLQTFKKCASFVHLIRDVGAPHLFWKSTFWPQHFLMFLGNVPLERRIHNCNCGRLVVKNSSYSSAQSHIISHCWAVASKRNQTPRLAVRLYFKKLLKKVTC